MEEFEAKLLTQQGTLQLIHDLEASLPKHISDDLLVQTVSRLKKSGIDPKIIPILLSQIRLRDKAVKKFGEHTKNLIFTPEGLEQATRLSVATEHAKRYRTAGITEITDVGCGIGGDAFAFSASGLTVHAIDSDPATAIIADHNLAHFSHSFATCKLADEAELEQSGALWFDPARRRVTKYDQKRLSNSEDWSPHLDFVFDWAKKKPTGIKLSPAFDKDLIPEGCEAQWISDHNDVVELVLWSGILARENVTRSALILNKEGSHELFAAEESHAVPAITDSEDLGEILYEPNGAVIRAGLIGALCEQLQAAPISDQIAYLSSTTYTKTAFATGFRILGLLSARKEVLKKELRARDIGTVEIKKRGIDVDPAVFRKQLKLSGKKSATLVLTRVAGRHCALLVERIRL